MVFDVSSVTPGDALAMALKSEFDTEKLYLKIQSQVKNFVLKDKLDFLISEEKKHQKLIEALYQKMFSGKIVKPAEKSLMPKLTLSLDETHTVPDLLEMAMDIEKLSEEVYDKLADETEERGIQELLRYLASMEHSHYFLIKGEYDLCIQDESYFERDDFQYDMVHIGP